MDMESSNLLEMNNDNFQKLIDGNYDQSNFAGAFLPSKPQVPLFPQGEQENPFRDGK